ncbi:MAG: thiamine phosphate synthase [Cypionkella sp.]|uniref:thiamine phosphate synthase n=1 Tax=Cypionkella sp. TaxID=2811411 RepID=UPI002ABCAC94|nr:thiamine phosphate synthase [Cypionkella sp.]MDZ4310499.1 thiamine phosphate synthase [Cypionkella sp.]MDZ4392168.1 thiamine phosphate synthase [Cypionkella sp.]
MILPRFYPVLPDAVWVKKAVRCGARLVQLRFKGALAEVPDQIGTAQAACARFGAQLVVNDHWQAALSSGANFVHLGQEDLDSADLPALARAGVRLGISSHDRAELARALALNPAYVALGPIYPTTLKVMKWQSQGLERLALWRQLAGNIPLVAIGGLTLSRLPGVFAAGADSAAVVTDLITAADPEARIKDWLAACEVAP